MTSDAEGSRAAPSHPSMGTQREFWDGWNSTHRLKGLDELMRRQRDVAFEWAKRTKPSRLLEVGCGTGWLSGALRPFGAVTGVDLSPSSIAEARARYPGATFMDGDFDRVNPGIFDFVVSVDVIAHVADQQRFVDRVAEWTRPGGTFVLMTQNPFVWNRSSYLAPQGSGQIRNWPSLGRLRGLLAGGFIIRHLGSLVPGGDLGVLRVANHRLIAGVLRRLAGKSFTTALYERAFIGRELVVVADRR